MTDVEGRIQSPDIQYAKDIKPEFDIGVARVLKFAPPEGFQIITRRTLMRRDSFSEDYPAKTINQGNKAEVEFQRAKAEKTGKPFTHPLIKPGFQVKAALLDIAFEGNTVSFDLKPQTFVQYNYNELGITKEENQDLRDNLGALTGVAAVLLTQESDGSRKMIIQHRGNDNISYKDVPGASIAGLLDGKLKPGTATLEPIDNAFVVGHLEKEGEEEIGIRPEEMPGLTITSLSEDRNRIHYEFTAMCQLSVSLDTLIKGAADGEAIEKGAFDFSEKFFAIDASPEAVWTLLTQVKCPIPPTHITAIAAAGYSLKAERDGISEAEVWRKELEIAVTENYKEIDEMSEGGRYNPKKTPQEQGLPDIMSEMKRTELIQSS